MKKLHTLIFLLALGPIGSPNSVQAVEPAATVNSASSPTRPSTREELLERARQRTGKQEPSMLDVFNEAMHEAKQAAGAIKEVGKPRIVPKGATPEIIIVGNTITYNGKPLQFGTKLHEWEKILGEPNRRFEDGPPTLLVWDKLGIAILTGQTVKNKDEVTQITIHLIKRPKDPYSGLVTHSPDGKPSPPEKEFTPREAFPGYLELDGFGIDAQTKFNEIARAANPKRNLHCGLRDCSRPAGALGPTSGVIYLMLDRPTENGLIYEISLNQGQH